MNIERENLKRVRELLNELELLESALNVTGNYDAKICAQFNTVHNNNEGRSKTVIVPISKKSEKSILDDIAFRIEEIKKELEAM